MPNDRPTGFKLRGKKFNKTGGSLKLTADKILVDLYDLDEGQMINEQYLDLENDCWKIYFSREKRIQRDAKTICDILKMRIQMVNTELYSFFAKTDDDFMRVRFKNALAYLEETGKIYITNEGIIVYCEINNELKTNEKTNDPEGTKI